jgi:Elongation factor Tu domain 2
MATRKKAKGKTNAKRKKLATKAAARRKTRTVRKKPAKKAPVRRASPKKARPTAKAAVKPMPASPPAQPVAATPSPPAQPTPLEERIGIVTHYYSHLSVATLRLESGTLRVGDLIHIRGHTTDFSQRVESLEVGHAPVTEVGTEDVGLKVVEHAREHDVVYKVPA